VNNITVRQHQCNAQTHIQTSEIETIALLISLSAYQATIQRSAMGEQSPAIAGMAQLSNSQQDMTTEVR